MLEWRVDVAHPEIGRLHDVDVAIEHAEAVFRHRRPTPAREAYHCSRHRELRYHQAPKPGKTRRPLMRHVRGLFATWLFLMPSTVEVCGAAPPEGQMTWGLRFSPTPGWFDPSESAGTVTSYHTLYALHDAMIRPSPGQPMSPSLAESWSTSPDGLVYEF